jgi:hypothetical protein
VIWRIVECFMFVAPGVYLLWRVWRDVRALTASKSWPSVSGRVVHTSCRERVIKGEDSETTLYEPLIQYEYQVGGQTHRGSRIALSEESCASSEKAFELLAAFPVGHPVNVFYDPAKPGDAVLQRRENKVNVFIAVAGWVLVVMGIAALFNDHLLDE